MPKVFIHYPAGTFPGNGIDLLAKDITEAAPAFEKLPDTPYAKSSIWIYAHEYPADRVYHGGAPGGTKVITFEINAIEGGLDATSRTNFIAFLTKAAGKYAGIPQGDRVPVFVSIRDVPAESWGMFGKAVTLEALRNPPADAVPI